jgi:hypothetical protein
MPGLEHLEFLLDLDAKVDGAVKLLGTLDRSIATLHTLEVETAKAVVALGKLDGASGRGADKHKKHAGAALNLGHAFDEAKEKAHSLLEAMGLMLVFEGIEKITEKVVELGGEILHAAAGAERFEKSFQLTLGAEGAEEILGWVEKIAKFTEFSDDRLKGVAGTLAQVGLRGNEMKRAIRGSLDIAAMTGGNLESAIESMAKLKRTGRIESRALAPLGLGEDDFLKQLSKRTGKPSAALKKDLEKGKVDTAQSMEALFDLIHARTGKALGAAGVDMSKTLGARITHLKDLPEQFFQGLSKSDGFARFSAILGKLLETLDPDSPTGKRIFANLDKAFTAFVDVLAKIDVDKFAKTLTTLFEKLPALIGGTTSALVALSAAMARFTGLTGPGAVGAGGHPLSEKALDTIPGTKKSIELSPEQQKDIAGFQNWMKKWLHLGNGASEAMANGLLENPGRLEAAGAEAGQKLYSGTAGPKGVDAHSPSKLFEELGAMSGEGFAQGLKGSMDGTAGTFKAGGFGRPAGGGAPQVTVHVNVNVAGHGGAGDDGEQLGQQVAAAVEHILPGALQSAFQRMGQEAGA